MKLKQILENKILIPRRSREERQKNLVAIYYRQIQDYIKNGSEGDLVLGETPLKILPPNLIRIDGNLFLGYSQITSLNNLKKIEGHVNLKFAPITSLGNLLYVGRNIILGSSNIKDLGNLKYVGGNLFLDHTPISETHTEEQIRKQVKVIGRIMF
jgi:hypothetical protein